MKHHIVSPHAPTAPGAERIRHSAAGPRNVCLHVPAGRKRTRNVSGHWSSAIPTTQTSNDRNWSPLSPKKVPELNKNLFLKISESKGHQPNNVNIKRKSCLQTCQRRPGLPAETKAPSVTSSSGIKSTLAFLFGHLSKPQEHPRAAKMTTKPRDTVSKWGDQFPLPGLPAAWLLVTKAPFSPMVRVEGGGWRSVGRGCLRCEIQTIWTEAFHARR